MTKLLDTDDIPKKTKKNVDLEKNRQTTKKVQKVEDFSVPGYKPFALSM